MPENRDQGIFLNGTVSNKTVAVFVIYFTNTRRRTEQRRAAGFEALRNED